MILIFLIVLWLNILYIKIKVEIYFYFLFIYYFLLNKLIVKMKYYKIIIIQFKYDILSGVTVINFFILVNLYV